MSLERVLKATKRVLVTLRTRSTAILVVNRTPSVGNMFYQNNLMQWRFRIRN